MSNKGKLDIWNKYAIINLGNIPLRTFLLFTSKNTEPLWNSDKVTNQHVPVRYLPPLTFLLSLFSKYNNSLEPSQTLPIPSYELLHFSIWSWHNPNNNFSSWKRCKEKRIQISFHIILPRLHYFHFAGGAGRKPASFHLFYLLYLLILPPLLLLIHISPFLFLSC